MAQTNDDAIKEKLDSENLGSDSSITQSEASVLDNNSEPRATEVLISKNNDSSTNQEKTQPDSKEVNKTTITAAPGTTCTDKSSNAEKSSNDGSIQNQSEIDDLNKKVFVETNSCSSTEKKIESESSSMQETSIDVLMEKVAESCLEVTNKSEQDITNNGKDVGLSSTSQSDNSAKMVDPAEKIEVGHDKRHETNSEKQKDVEISNTVEQKISSEVSKVADHKKATESIPLIESVKDLVSEENSSNKDSQNLEDNLKKHEDNKSALTSQSVENLMESENLKVNPAKVIGKAKNESQDTKVCSEVKEITSLKTQSEEHGTSREKGISIVKESETDINAKESTSKIIGEKISDKTGNAQNISEPKVEGKKIENVTSVPDEDLKKKSQDESEKSSGDKSLKSPKNETIISQDPQKQTYASDSFEKHKSDELPEVSKSIKCQEEKGVNIKMKEMEKAIIGDSNVDQKASAKAPSETTQPDQVIVKKSDESADDERKNNPSTEIGNSNLEKSAVSEKTKSLKDKEIDSKIASQVTDKLEPIPTQEISKGSPSTEVEKLSYKDSQLNSSVATKQPTLPSVGTNLIQEKQSDVDIKKSQKQIDTSSKVEPKAPTSKETVCVKTQIDDTASKDIRSDKHGDESASKHETAEISIPKSSDSPKRVKLVRPEFDKAKLAEKIREIEERERLKLANKLREQELAASNEKSVTDSSQNEPQIDELKKKTSSDNPSQQEPHKSERSQVAEALKEKTSMDSKISKDSEKDNKVGTVAKSLEVDVGLKQEASNVSKQVKIQRTEEESIEKNEQTSIKSEKEVNVVKDVKNVDVDLVKKVEMIRKVGDEESISSIVKCKSNDETEKDVELRQKQKKTADSHIIQKPDTVTNVSSNESVEKVVKIAEKIEAIGHASDKVENSSVTQTFEPGKTIESKESGSGLKTTIKAIVEPVNKEKEKSEDIKHQGKEDKSSLVVEKLELASKVGNNSSSELKKEEFLENVDEKKNKSKASASVMEEQKSSSEGEGKTSVPVVLDKKSVVKNDEITEDLKVVGNSKDLLSEEKPDLAKKIESSKSVSSLDKQKPMEPSVEQDDKEKSKTILCVEEKIKVSIEEKLEPDVESKNSGSSTEKTKSNENVPKKYFKNNEEPKVIEKLEKNIVDSSFTGKLQVGSEVSTSKMEKQKSIEDIKKTDAKEDEESKLEGGKKAAEKSKKPIETFESKGEVSSSEKQKSVKDITKKDDGEHSQVKKIVDSFATGKCAAEKVGNKESASRLEEEKSIENIEKKGHREQEDTKSIREKDMDLSVTKKHSKTEHFGIEQSDAVKQKSSEHTVKVDIGTKNDELEFTEKEKKDSESSLTGKSGKNVDKSKSVDKPGEKSFPSSVEDTEAIPENSKTVEKSLISEESKASDIDNSIKPEGTPPLESILDSLITSEPDLPDVTEDDLVISDVPSMALVESKIPESPRRVKLVRPVKPVSSRTLTQPGKPQVTNNAAKIKPVEKTSLPDEKTNIEKTETPPEKPSSEKLQSTERADTTKSNKVETSFQKSFQDSIRHDNAAQPSEKSSSVKLPQLEKKLNPVKELPPAVEIDSEKAQTEKSSSEANKPLEEASAQKMSHTDKKVLEQPTSVKQSELVEKPVVKLLVSPVETSQRDTVSQLQSVEKSNLEKPTIAKENLSRVEGLPVTDKSTEESIEKSITVKESQLTDKSTEKSFEKFVTVKESQLTDESTGKVSEPSEKSETDTKHLQNPVSEKVLQPLGKSVKSDSKLVKKPSSEKTQPPESANIDKKDVQPVSLMATPKPLSVEKEECVSVTKKENTEIFIKDMEEMSKGSEKVSTEKLDQTPKKESEASKLRKIIRKPKLEREKLMRMNESKEAEAKAAASACSIASSSEISSIVQSKNDEKKQMVAHKMKRQATDEIEASEVKKIAMEDNIFLDMTVDDDDDAQQKSKELSEIEIVRSESKKVVEKSEINKSESVTNENKPLGFKLKIANSSTTIIPKDEKVSQPVTSTPILAEKLMSQKSSDHSVVAISASHSGSVREKHKPDMKKVEAMLKDTDVTITPLVDRDPLQKLSKITLKIGKDGNPPEIKQTSESWKQLDADIVPVKRKSSDLERKSDEEIAPKKIKEESAVLTTSSGVEIDLHMKKPKLLTSLISEPPLTPQDPRLMGVSSPMTPQQTRGNLFLGTPESPHGLLQGNQGSGGSEVVVKKKRGRPRKFPLPDAPPQEQLQIQQRQAMMQMQAQQMTPGAQHSSGGSGSDDYSSGVFPQVPLFDMAETLFDQSHLFPNQVNPLRGRPQRSCRGRIKLPSVRTRKPRGATLAARGGRGRGRGRGRGIKRQFTESEHIITLENVKEEMRRQSLDQPQFIGSNDPVEMDTVQLGETASGPTSDPVQGTMKSPDRKPRKRKNEEEEERERIEKIKQRREERKQKTLEKKRKIAEAKAKEKAAVMAAALAEEETRMSAPERKDEDKKKDFKTEEIKVEGENEVPCVEVPIDDNSIAQEPEKSPEKVVQFDQLIQAQEPIEVAKEPCEVDLVASEEGTEKVEPSSFQDIKKESSATTTEGIETFVTPKKEKKVYRCLICKEESPLKKLTSPLDHRSWRVLYQAAIVRGNDEIINLTKDLSDEIPTGILYHRNCRSEFTHKKTLAKLTECPIPEDQPITMKTPGAENLDPNTPKEVIIDCNVIEYHWPLEGGELYMIQEQVSDFLETTSFKRKYPDIMRRTVEPEERIYLRENGLVSEALCDLGLTAVKSSDVLDIMFADFQDKYEEFRKQIRDKQARELSSKHKAAFTSLLMDKRKFENRVTDVKQDAMQAVANWNSRLNKARTDKRRCMLDLQSMIVHYPKTVGIKRANVPNPPGKVEHYPLALVPGQFCDNYKRYTPAELKYFPLSTVIYGPMKPNERHGGGSDGSQSDSDDSSSSDDSSDSSSESSQDSDGSCDESNEKEVKERPVTETHCKVCGGDKTRNKQDNPEVLINCAQCTKSSQLFQLNRVPTVVLSNVCSNLNLKNVGLARNSPILSKNIRTLDSSYSVNSQTPVKRMKLETSTVELQRSTVVRNILPAPSTEQPRNPVGTVILTKTVEIDQQASQSNSISSASIPVKTVEVEQKPSSESNSNLSATIIPTKAIEVEQQLSSESNSNSSTSIIPTKSMVEQQPSIESNSNLGVSNVPTKVIEVEQHPSSESNSNSSTSLIPAKKVEIEQPSSSENNSNSNATTLPVKTVEVEQQPSCEINSSSSESMTPAKTVIEQPISESNSNSEASATSSETVQSESV